MDVGCWGSFVTQTYAGFDDRPAIEPGPFSSRTPFGGIAHTLKRVGTKTVPTLPRFVTLPRLTYAAASVGTEYS